MGRAEECNSLPVDVKSCNSAQEIEEHVVVVVVVVVVYFLFVFSPGIGRLLYLLCNHGREWLPSYSSVWHSSGMGRQG